MNPTTSLYQPFKGLRLHHPSWRKQCGATTGEFIFWSILAAGVLLIGLTTYLKGDRASSALSLVKDFTNMAAEAGQLYSGNWANFNTQNADNAGLFKGYSAFIDNGGGNVTVKVGGGQLTVAPGTLVTADDSGQYTLTQLPFEGCKHFVAAVQKGAGSVTVNSTVVKPYGGAFSPELMQCKETGNTVIVVRAT